jgi:glycosyltransferase involved in cell wall biosynthesis
MISVLILTRNEELDLPGCLPSVAWSDDVRVFDSFSTDTTAEIARSAKAHLHQRVSTTTRHIATPLCK